MTDFLNMGADKVYVVLFVGAVLLALVIAGIALWWEQRPTRKHWSQ